MKNAKQYFDSDKSVGRLYFTSDHLAFFDKDEALEHSKKLFDKKINVMTRAEAESQIDGIANESSGQELEDLLDELTGVH